jgi:protein-S-isoprenylcysteine O-methyltransferase Ste14
MKRALVFAYGVLSYAFFFVTFLYAIGFIGNIFVPKSIDSAPTATLGTALLVNGLFLAIFAIQHSGMARPAFKRWLTRYIPASAERSTYVLASTVCLALLMYYWVPMGGVIWNVTTNWAALTLTALYLASWLLLLYATFLIDHFDLFGLRQSWFGLRGKEHEGLQFVTPQLYRLIRHPIYLGWLGIMWFTPTMTISHLVFALGSTGYIFVGMALEERDLEKMHPEYAQYKRKVPALFPSLTRRLGREVEIQSA